MSKTKKTATQKNKKNLQQKSVWQRLQNNYETLDNLDNKLGNFIEEDGLQILDLRNW
ncbi:hypothetical protein GF362_01710 [Candidatus Dojkabacteria bacterium]|nr:hypothetical protein [Candidatus Dojkabacteria bacterium]